MTVLSLAYYSFAWNNYIFGGSSSVHQVLSVEGLEALPAIRNQDDNRGYQDGMFSGNDFFAGRTVTITILTLGGNGYSAQYNYNLLQAQLLPQTTGTTPLQFQMSNVSALQRINARVRTNVTSVDPDYTYGYIKSQYSFFCPDPKYYDDAEQLSTLSLSNPLGRTYNRVYPLLYGGGSAATYTLVTNNGWTATYPTITLNGPITNPILGNFTQGLYTTLTGSYTASDIIVLDLENRIVTLNGSSARNLVAGGSNWFSAPPGNSQFYLSGAGTLVGTTQATVSYRSAYI